MRVTDFAGMRPKLDPRRLGPNEAEYAENCTFETGAVTPIRQPRYAGGVVTVDGAPAEFSPRTLHNINGVWVGWPGIVSVAKDPLKRGGEDAFLFVEDGELKRSSGSWITDGDGPTTVGIHRPCEPPAPTVVDGCDWFKADFEGCLEEAMPQDEICDPNQDAPITTAFLFTYVNGCDEESAPSPPSDMVQMRHNQGAMLSFTDTPPPGATHRRVYALLVGSEQSSGWFLFSEDPVDKLAVMYCPGAYDHHDILVSEGWDEVPPCVDGVALVGDAVSVLWHGREIFLSEPRQPHAYPRKYVKRVDYPITQVVTLTDTPEGDTHYDAVILTTGAAYLLIGTLPEDIEVRKIGREAPHINPGRAISYAGVVVFASRDGLYAVQGGRVTNLTSELWAYEAWQEVWAEQASIGYTDNHLLVMGSAGVSSDQGRSFLLPWGRRDNPYPEAMVWVSSRADALYFRDDLPLHIAGDGGVYQWAAGDERMRMTWRSPVYTQRALWHPTAAKILSDAERLPPDAAQWVNRAQLHYGRVPTADETLEFIRLCPDAAPYLPYLRHPVVWFKLIAYKDLVFERPVWSMTPFRLKRDRRMVEWQFEVSSTRPVYEAHIQTSQEDLGQEGGHA